MTNTIMFSYQHKRYYIENTLGYTFSKNPIMEKINRTTDNLGNTLFEFDFDNQKNRSQMWNYLAGQYYIIPDKFTLQGGISYQSFKSNGNNYAHTYNRIWGIVQADLMLNNWNLGVKWNSKESSLMGETISYGSDYSELYINYQLKNMTFGVNWSYIFKKNGNTSGDITENIFLNKKLNVFVPDWGNMISLSLGTYPKVEVIKVNKRISITRMKIQESLNTK